MLSTPSPGNIIGISTIHWFAIVNDNNLVYNNWEHRRSKYSPLQNSFVLTFGFCKNVISYLSFKHTPCLYCMFTECKHHDMVTMLSNYHHIYCMTLLRSHCKNICFGWEKELLTWTEKIQLVSMDLEDYSPTLCVFMYIWYSCAHNQCVFTLCNMFVLCSVCTMCVSGECVS